MNLLGPHDPLKDTLGNHAAVSSAAVSITRSANSAPAFPSSESGARSVDENAPAGRNVGTPIAATDADNDRRAYSISGTDAAFFDVVASSGQLRTKGALDRESRSSYSFTMSVTDNKDIHGLADTVIDDMISVTVTVIDVDEPAEVTFAAGGGVTANNNALTVDENHTGTLATFSASDPENKPGLTYTWSVGGTDASDFGVTSAGVLSFIAAPDYERPADSGGNNVYDITVNALDSDGKTGRIAVTVTVAPVNDPPTVSGDASPSIEEQGALLVGTYQASDPENATIAWQPLGGNDADKFDFNASNGRLSFKTVPDYEDAQDSGGNNVYDVTLSASAGGHTTELDVAVSVTNKDEPGALAFPATRPQEEAAYTATLSDPDGVVSTTWTWERSTSRTSSWAAVSGAVDGVTTSTYTPVAGDVGYYLRATAAYEDGHAANKSLVVVSSRTVRAKPVVNNPPEFASETTTRSVAENARVNATVGARVTASDPDSGDTVRYEIDPTSDLFTIDGSSGQIRVKEAGSLDHESAPSHTVTVRASDNSNASDTIDVTIMVTDANEPPEAEDDHANVDEDDSVTIDVLANDSDPEDNVSDLTVSAGSARNGQVVVNVPQNPGELYTITYTPRANYHGADSFTYTVRDSGSPSRSDNANVSINVTSVNDDPTFGSATASRSVSESSGEGDNVGVPVTATDIDGERLTYRLFGTDAGFFGIDPGSGQVTVGTGVTFDIGARDRYVVTVEAEDPNGGRATVGVTITVTTGPVLPPIIISGGGGGGGPSGPTPSQADFEWTVKHDIEALAAGHDGATGMWSDGATLWLAHNGDGADDAVYAYALETGERVEDREFELDERNRAPRGVWSDRQVIWVSDSGQNKLFAHDLKTGERLPERDLALAERNRDARGIWSAGGTMWVLNGRTRDALFAYELANGELLAEYALDDSNGDPHGIWSDGVTVWVSDHGEKDLLAYRLPVIGAEDAPTKADLERVRDEDFTELSKASNNSPRGIWSDGEVMYVADASDDKVYSYNMPDAIDARLASLTLEGIDIGEFDSSLTDYESTLSDEVTQTAVEVQAQQSVATVVIEPPDADEAAEGHQVTLEGVTEIAVTVTSADGSRKKVYRVRLRDPEPVPWPHCLRGAIAVSFSLVVYEGGTVEELAACAQSRNVTALYALHEGVYVSYILGAPELVNSAFAELFAGGVPTVTPLVAGSDGPASEDPVPDDAVSWPWPECLRGEIVEGFNLLVYQGGSVEDLVACAQSRNVTALYALHEGVYLSYILGAPELVNSAFAELFAGGVPAVTPLVGKSSGPPGAGSARSDEQN